MNFSKKINLIPAELSVGGGINKISKQLTNTSIAAAVVAGFAVVVFLGIVIFYNQDFKKINSSNNTLKNQITALQQSEQKLVFAKDRLGKIAEVQAQETALGRLVDFNFLYDFLKSNSDLSVLEVSINSDKLEMSIISTTLSATTSFFNFLNENKEDFDRIKISTFSYSPSSGYVVNLVFKDK